MTIQKESRRDFVRKAAYVAPAILSLSAFSSLAKAGSSHDSAENEDRDNDENRFEQRRRRRRRRQP